MKIVAIANQKGGVGKTTTCRNLASYLGTVGYKVLVIDCDNQANLTDCFDITNDEKQINLYHLMKMVLEDKDFPDKESFIISKEKNVDVIGTSVELSNIEINLSSAISREYVLQTIIDYVKSDYDYILLDSMPSLGLLTINVLAAVDSVIIPASPEYLSAKGLEHLISSILKVKKRINKQLEVEGILLTMVDSNTNLSKQMKAAIKNHYEQYVNVFKINIPKTVKVGEANSRKKSVFEYCPNHKISKAYADFGKEFIKGGE